MKFCEVENALKEGKKSKLSYWDKAYWYQNKDGMLMNHFEDGEEVPTLALFPCDCFMVMCDKWEVIEEENAADDQQHIPSDTISFGDALNFLKAGKKIARKGWNGKGMFLVFCPGSEVSADRMRVKAVKQFYKQEKCTPVIIAPHIDLKAADGTYVTGWLASQTDMLADDWYVV